MNIERMKVKSNPIFKIIAGVGCGFIAAGAMLLQVYQIRLRNTVTYKKALDKVYNHEETIKLLGQPIKEGKITFRDHNTDNSRLFSVNLIGSITKGKLDCEFIIHEDNKTELTKLAIKYDNLPNETFVIHGI